MARQKVERIKVLPSDPVERERLKKSLEEYVAAMIRLDDSKSEMKDIVDVEKDTHNIDSKFFKTLALAEYDRQYEAEKKRKELEDKVEHFNEADILFGRK